MGEKLRGFWKRETVLCVSALCAVATMFLAPPDGAYLGYIDFRVLGLLLALMAVVAGFQACGAFRWLGEALLRWGGGGRRLGVTLVLLPFFTAMAVTNDVALITFVPFTLGLLEELDCRDRAIPLLVLQTIAANLGSMATPVGNPQNLYLYGAYDLTAGAFFPAVLPLTALSFAALTLAALPVLPRAIARPAAGTAPAPERGRLICCGALFLLCLLAVFRAAPWQAVTALVVVVMAVREREVLKTLDVSLLATFVCFFIVSGNLGRVEPVRVVLQGLLDRSALLTSALASQVISNVPAAVLLSGFTDNWRGLIQGTNIGGLGTPVASLASLITLKAYLRWPGARPGRYLLWFTGANVAGLIFLLAAAQV